MVSKYNLISRFSRSTKNVLFSAKLLCYSPFQFKVGFVNTELKFWIKLRLETSIVYLFMTIWGLQVLYRGKRRHRTKTGLLFWKRIRWNSAINLPIRKFVICILLRINHLLKRADYISVISTDFLNKANHPQRCFIWAVLCIEDLVEIIIDSYRLPQRTAIIKIWE